MMPSKQHTRNNSKIGSTSMHIRAKTQSDFDDTVGPYHTVKENVKPSHNVNKFYGSFKLT